MLFDDKQRNCHGPMTEAETHFQFYDRSARPEMAQKREHLNRWLCEMGEDHGRNLASAMRKDPNQFITGELEIILHRVATKQGFEVQIHPESPSGRRPDFYLKNEEVGVYLEATCVMPEDASDKEARRKAPVIDAINQLKLPAGHWLSVHDLTSDGSNPKVNRITKSVRDFVDSILGIASGETASEEILVDGWTIDISLVNTGSGTQYDRAIGTLSGGLGWVDPAGDMKRRLELKAKRYGALQAPFVIALANWKHPGDNTRSFQECLFGKPKVIVNLDTHELHEGRDLNGFWGYQEKPANQHVSAVILFPESPHWAAIDGNRQPILIHNPFATYELDEGFLNLPFMKFNDGGVLMEHAGDPLADLLFG